MPNGLCTQIGQWRHWGFNLFGPRYTQYGTFARTGDVNDHYDQARRRDSTAPTSQAAVLAQFSPKQTDKPVKTSEYPALGRKVIKIGLELLGPELTGMAFAIEQHVLAHSVYIGLRAVS